MVLTVLAMTLLTITGIANGSEKENVKKAVTDFANAADNSDVVALDEILDDNFRLVMNRLMGSEQVSVITKDVYLDMIKEGKLGGVKRTRQIHHVDITENNAVAKVSLLNDKMIINSYLLLVKDKNGKWKIVNDLPSVIVK